MTPKYYIAIATLTVLVAWLAFLTYTLETLEGKLDAHEQAIANQGRVICNVVFAITNGKEKCE